MRLTGFSDSWTPTILSSVCSYRKLHRTSKKKCYVSTENILQNYQGIERFESDDIVSGNAFFCDDILMGNIRPYLKKVCIAEFDGVCNTDVLVFKSETVKPHFLHCVLANDNFINYVMSSVKGSKMPRGDKGHIMQYPLSIPSVNEQEKIAHFISLLNERISTQSKIIEELELLKSTISNTLFDRPSVEEKRLDTYYFKGKAGGTPTSTKKEYYGGDIPFLSISDMTEQGKYLYYTDKRLTEKGLKNSAAWIVPTNSLVFSMYASVGLVAINKVPISTSQAMFSMVIKDSFELEYLYYFLSYFKEKKLHRLLETGTQSNINADMVRNIMIADFGYEENRKIVRILKTYDKKIQIEKDILSAYKKQKAYLLKEMFI